MKTLCNNLINYAHTETEDVTKIAFSNHVHSEYEFLYFLNGKADYIINGSVYNLRKRDFLLIQPGEYHRLIPTPGFTYERVCLHFSPFAVPDEYKDAIKMLKPVVHIQKYSAIDNVFSALINAGNENEYSEDDMRYLITQNIGIILAHLKYLQAKEYVTPASTNQFINSILDYVDQNITKLINVNTLSKVFFKSPSTISHCFAKEMKYPIQQYILNKKIVYAQTLIQHGATPTSVALELSFKDYSTFFKAYKRILGVKPTEDLPKKILG